MAKAFSHWIILGLVVILCLLEIGAYRIQGELAVIASHAWAVMGVAYFTATAVLIVGSLLSDWWKGKFVFTLLVIGLAIMVYYRLGDMYHLQINYESASQLASFLKFNIHRPDWGYTGTAFVGYPARQFIIVAIPSLLFGNEVVWLQFGYATLFYSGVLCFYLGVRHYFAAKQISELWALVTVVSCFIFPYLILYIYNMEQILVPISLVTHALGWLLLSLEKLTVPRVLILAWISGLLGTSYTPTLAAWALFQSFFFLLMVRAAREKRWVEIVLWFSVLAYTATFGLCSNLTRTDTRLGPHPGLAQESLLKGFKVFFLGHPQPYMPTVVAVFVAIFFLLALTGRLGLIKWITAVWMLGVIYFSATANGYAPYDPAFTLYRSILLIPILMLACWDTYLGLFKKLTSWKKFTSLKQFEPILAVLLCAAVTAGSIHQYFQRGRGYGPQSKEYFISFLLKQAEAAGIRRRPATFVSMTQQVTYHPIQGYGEYFFPNWHVLIYPQDKLDSFNPNPSEPVLMISDIDVEQKDCLPTGWTGTEEVKYMDARRNLFPVRIGLFRWTGNASPVAAMTSQ